MTTGTTHTVFYGYQGTSTLVLRVDFGYTAPNFQIRAGLVNTASTWTNTSWYTITKATHYIEFDWRVKWKACYAVYQPDRIFRGAEHIAEQLGSCIGDLRMLDLISGGREHYAEPHNAFNAI